MFSTVNNDFHNDFHFCNDKNHIPCKELSFLFPSSAVFIAVARRFVYFRSRQFSIWVRWVVGTRGGLMASAAFSPPSE